VPLLKRVLIIEDNPDVALYASMLIESSGLAVPTILHDGLEGLVACFKDPPDALVLDLDLPSMNGDDILRFLRTSNDLPHLPILIISALPEGKRRELQLLKMGADAYMEKPILERTFLDTLHRLLSRQETIPGIVLHDSTASPPSQAFIQAVLQRELEDEGPVVVQEESPQPSVEDREILEVPTGPAATPTPVKRVPDTASDVDEKNMDEAFEGYQLLRIIGSGGMGTVYKAEQLSLRRIVALKVLLENLQRKTHVRERFEREALIMAQINHPNIVQVYETGSTDHTSYFAMEYVDGASLGRRIRKGSLEWVECLEVVRQTCNGIAYLHSRGIFHRDIKPSNILISRWGPVKITDFGISRARLQSDRREFTQVLQFMGTPEYMAPELTDPGRTGERSDLYSLGMTFWRMFAGPDIRVAGTPLHDIHPEIPRALSIAISRCIHPEPSRRFATVTEARDAILEAASDFTGTRTPVTWASAPA